MTKEIEKNGIPIVTGLLSDYLTSAEFAAAMQLPPIGVPAFSYDQVTIEYWDEVTVVLYRGRITAVLCPHCTDNGLCRLDSGLKPEVCYLLGENNAKQFI